LRVPLAASWHTNLHEYAEQRAQGWLALLPGRDFQTVAAERVRETSLQLIMRFYKMARILFAPNRELMGLLEKGTGKPVRPMRRGVDASLFSPARRGRRKDDRTFVIGFVGRLTVEKNIRLLAKIEAALFAAGISGFRFSIVGQGAEEEWLKANMRTANLTGVLHGEALATAYANMDAFVFPSRTDTFGNVVLEALACGVPAIVTDCGGPQFIVKDGETGFIARDLGGFVGHIRHLMEHPGRRQAMREAARDAALQLSWDKIFRRMYEDYAEALRSLGPATKALARPQRRVVAPRLG
jgi:phosphatidylinositol alpha 1,6-mannosyltransferase